MGAGQQKWDQPISPGCVVGRHCKDWSRSAQSTAERVAATCAPRRPPPPFPSFGLLHPTMFVRGTAARASVLSASVERFVCLCVCLFVCVFVWLFGTAPSAVAAHGSAFVRPVLVSSPLLARGLLRGKQPSSVAAHAVLHPCCVWPHLDLRHASVGRCASWVGGQTR